MDFRLGVSTLGGPDTLQSVEVVPASAPGGGTYYAGHRPRRPEKAVPTSARPARGRLLVAVAAYGSAGPLVSWGRTGCAVTASGVALRAAAGGIQAAAAASEGSRGYISASGAVRGAHGLSGVASIRAGGAVEMDVAAGGFNRAEEELALFALPY